MIELKNVSKTFNIQEKQFYALKEINLKINRGEIVGILGPSGAGKSTLLRTLNLLEPPTDGQVFVNDTDLTRLKPVQLKEQRKKIAMIFQQFNLLKSRTAFENISLPLELLGFSQESISKEVKSLLQLTGLKQHGQHYPHQLSGGQQQRVGIARALATKPDILLCDEPTSALDIHSTQSILNLLREINQNLGVTIVLITHELEVIKQCCHRVGVLDQGSLIEFGSVIELFAKPKTQVSKQLVQKALHLELPKAIASQLSQEFSPGKSYLVRFTFVGDNSGQPLISILVKQFNITINIIQANIESIADAVIGFTVCLLNGDPESIKAALDFVNQSSVSAEVLGYVV